MQLALKVGKPWGTSPPSHTPLSHFLHSNLQGCITQLALWDPDTITISGVFNAFSTPLNWHFTRLPTLPPPSNCISVILGIPTQWCHYLVLNLNDYNLSKLETFFLNSIWTCYSINNWASMLNHSTDTRALSGQLSPFVMLFSQCRKRSKPIIHGLHPHLGTTMGTPSNGWGKTPRHDHQCLPQVLGCCCLLVLYNILLPIIQFSGNSTTITEAMSDVRESLWVFHHIISSDLKVIPSALMYCIRPRYF